MGVDRAGMDAGRGPVLLVGTGGTLGWRTAVAELAAGLTRGGASVVTVTPSQVRPVRTFMLTDLVQAAAARRAAARAIEIHRPSAIVYCSVTAALLWPVPGAIWLDAVAADNRPGRHGLWQRPVERRRLASASLVLTWSPGALAPLPPRADAIVVPPPVDPSGPPSPLRDIEAVVYGADPIKRRLDLVIAAWTRARRDGETLWVTGVNRADTPWAAAPPPGVRFTGRLAAAEHRALLRRARVFVAAPRREDFGIAALEALADGAMLVTTPAPGPYVALPLARRLDPRLVSDDLSRALRCALDDPRPGYAEQAAELMAPFGRDAVTRTIRDRVLPALMPGWDQ